MAHGADQTVRDINHQTALELALDNHPSLAQAFNVAAVAQKEEAAKRRGTRESTPDGAEHVELVSAVCVCVEEDDEEGREVVVASLRLIGPDR